MKNLQGYIVVFLLALFAVTIVPKELYHDCGHFHIHASDLQKDEINEGDCPICDYTFSSPIQVHNATQSEISLLVTGYAALEQQVISLPSPGLPTLRGPPLS